MKINKNNYLCVMFVISSMLIMNAANAANWLMLQGITDSPYPLVWGFLQPAYMRSSGATLPTQPAGNPWAGQQALANVIQPDLSSSRVFQIQRTRVGIRGALPDDEKISYFLLAEYGNNGITQPGGGGGRVTLTDATITFTHLKEANIRIGQMKIPMSEEVYQGIVTFNYINLTNIANQQLVERPLWTDGATPCMPAASSANYLRFCNGDAQIQFRSAVVAVRDIGIQIFDSFKQEDWEHSYAVLIGQGGANKDTRNDSLDNTIYWSSEKIYGGMKAFREGYKLYAWRTSGKRTLYDSATLSAGGASLAAAERQYDRKLAGIGVTYFDNKYRFWAELIRVDGMIFDSSTGGAIPGATSNNGKVVSQFRINPDGKGDGGYLDFGYRLNPKIELDVRYDWYNRVTNLLSTDERKFETLTFGAQYFFTKTTKVIVNFEMRDVEAPGFPSSNLFNVVADAVDDRISAQIFIFF